MHIVCEGLKKGVTRVRKGHVIVLKIYLRVCIVQVNVKRGKNCVSVMCVLRNQISLRFVVKAHILLKLPSMPKSAPQYPQRCVKPGKPRLATTAIYG